MVGARDENRKLLLAWLIIYMIAIILLVLGALAFLASGINILSNREKLQQAVDEAGFEVDVRLIY